MPNGEEYQAGGGFPEGEEPREYRLDVRISSDGMRAQARLSARKKEGPAGGREQAGTGAPPSSETGFTPEALKEALAQEKVIFGLEEQALRELCATPNQWFVVARGIPPRQGQNGFVEYHYEEILKPVVYQENERQVDYRERYTIQQVEEGTVIATIHPPVPGEPGIKVTGEQVAPKPVVPAVVKCREGASLSPDGTRVIARTKGRPVYRRGREHIFQVENFYVHQGPVNMESGNLYFEGDLIVKGDVEEGMKVLAGGDLEIHGSAAGANLKAGGNIRLHQNCIQTQVQAGSVGLFMMDVHKLLVPLETRLEQLLAASRQLQKALQERGQHVGERFPVLMFTLIKVKFADLGELLEQMRKLETNMEFKVPERIAGIIDRGHRFFNLYDPALLQDLQALEGLYRSIEKARQEIEKEETARSRAGITAGYVQNSKLTCPGDILITGPGSYQSHFVCGGTVRIERLFRGGSIEAAGDVYIGEAGSDSASGIQGVIKIPAESKVHFGKVFSNIAIKIGSTSFNFDSTYHNICAYWDKEAQAPATRPWFRK